MFMKKREKLNILTKIVISLFTIVYLISFWCVLRVNVLPKIYIGLFLVGFLLFYALCLFLIYHNSKVHKSIGYVLIALLSIASIFVIVITNDALSSYNNVLNKSKTQIENLSKEEINPGKVTPEDLGVPNSDADIKNGKVIVDGVEVEVLETTLNAEKDGEIKSFDRKEIDGTEPFVVYFSGADSYREISIKSRSDVNVVAAINPQKKKILLVNIPRDTYVSIPGTGGYYDKLTHAGLIGPIGSKDALANLLDVSIDSYAKVNFSSVINIVDTLGGVTINNPAAFSTRGGVSFESGKIRLNGKETLAFVRERYNLAGGDNDRGENQMRVMKGLLNEALKPSNLIKYKELLNSFSSMIVMDFPYEAISNLVKNELNNPGGWEVKTYNIYGTGKMGLYSYFMPNYKLYFTVPDETSINEAHNLIEKTLEQW